ncbi:MAG: hypothetical protein JW924_00025, partial [Fusobacteriaceae bacterium]|nr:hypothetical protein [Fusobacteriaceae bacterium]
APNYSAAGQVYKEEQKLLEYNNQGQKLLTYEGGSTVDINKLNHIFGKESHNLNNFLKKYSGDQIKAYKALELATQKYVDLNKMTGTFKDIRVNVSGVTITVRGAVVNGKVKIGTAFIP